MKEKILSKINIVSIFAVFAGVWAIIMSIAVPVSQTPDEYTHFINMMYAYGTTDYIAETTGMFYAEAGLSDFNVSENHPVDEVAYKTAGMKRYEHHLRPSDFNIGINAVKYIPAALGFYLGAIFRLPKLICLQMAEFFSTVFFILMGILTLKLAPFKKAVFLFVLLMPMTIQQCSSINPDVMIITCSLFMTALILNMKFREGKVTWKDIIILIVITLVFFVVKMIYMLLLAAILIVPIDKFYLPIGKKFDLAVFIKKYKWVCLVFVILAASGFVFLCRNQYFFKVLFACALQPGRTLFLMKVTLSNLLFYYMQTTVGCFGWLDTFVSNQFIVIFFCILVFINLFLPKAELETYKGLKIRDRIVMVIIALGVMGLVLVSMATWSFELDGLDPNVDVATIRGYLYQISSLLGVQGRYIIPVIPMFVVPLGVGTEIGNKKSYYGTQIVFYLYTFYYVMKLVMYRYWG